MDEDILTEIEKKEEDANERRIRQLNQTICICNGIKLARILRVLDTCETIADVNKKAGTGSGGCKGERCGPKIRILLKKQRNLEGSKK